MSAWAVTGIAALYVAASPLFQEVLAVAGLFAPLFFAGGGALCLLVAWSWRRFGLPRAAGAAMGAALFAFMLADLARLLASSLYSDETALSLTVWLGVFALLGLVVRASALRYACRMVFGCGLLLYLLILGIGVAQGDATALWPAPTLTLAQIGNCLGQSFLAFTPLLLPLTADSERRLAPTVVAVGGLVGVSAADLVAYPAALLGPHSDLFLEVARNLSFGRFFQRMAFPGALLILLLSLLMILVAVARFRAAIEGERPTRIRRSLTLCLFVLSVAAALWLREEGVALAVAGVAALLGALCGPLWRKRRRVIPLTLALICLTMTSCLSYHEIDTYEYPLIVGVERAGEGARFHFRSQSGTVSVCADGLTQARDAVNRQRPKPLDLSQLGMVILPAGDEALLRACVEEIEHSRVDNAVLVAVTNDNLEELRGADFSSYHSISEFFDEFKAQHEPFDFVDRTAFEACASLQRTKTLLVPAITFAHGQLLSSGAVAYGKSARFSVTNEQLQRVSALRVQDVDAHVANGVLTIRLKRAGEESAWIADLYDATGRDVLGAYARLARRAFDETAYRLLCESIRETVIER